MPVEDGEQIGGDKTKAKGAARQRTCLGSMKFSLSSFEGFP